MKKNIVIIICVVIIIALAVTVGVLAKRQADSAKRHEDMFRSSIEQTAYHLSRYIESGDEHEYCETLSQLEAALTISMLIDGKSNTEEMLEMDLYETYGCLSLKLDKAEPYLEELHTALFEYVTNEYDHTSNGNKVIFEYKLRNFTHHVNE